MQNGGSEVDDLRSRLIVEQSSISLVAALFMTVSISQMFVCDAWDQDWKQGVYGLLINLASAGLVIAVLTSIIFILAVNECNTNSELKRFRSNMGLLLEFPFISFAFGAIMFGGITLCFWCYRTFTLDWLCYPPIKGWFSLKLQVSGVRGHMHHRLQPHSVSDRLEDGQQSVRRQGGSSRHRGGEEGRAEEGDPVLHRQPVRRGRRESGEGRRGGLRPRVDGRRAAGRDDEEAFQRRL